MINASKRRKAAGMQSKKLKPPPYSKPIFAARRAGLVPKHGLGHVTIVFDWRPTYLRNLPFVVMPSDKSPKDFDWSFCRGLQVVIVHLDKHDDLVPDLLRALYAAGVRHVRIAHIDRMARDDIHAWAQIKWLVPTP